MYFYFALWMILEEKKNREQPPLKVLLTVKVVTLQMVNISDQRQKKPLNRDLPFIVLLLKLTPVLTRGPWTISLT